MFSVKFKRIISLNVIVSILISVITPWRGVRALEGDGNDSAVHVHNVQELDEALKSNRNIVLEEDISFSGYTFEYSDEYKRVGIYLDGELKAAYDTCAYEYYEDYVSDTRADFAINHGNNPYIAYYSGTIEGNGHVISGIINDKETGRACIVANSMEGEVNNLVIENCFVDNNFNEGSALLCSVNKGVINNVKIGESCFITGGNSIGSFALRSEGRICGCESEAHIYSNDSEKSGGIVAELLYGISECTFSGEISGKGGDAGGIAAVSMDGKLIYPYLDIRDFYVSNSSCKGNINGEFTNAAGIIGVSYDDIRIDDCINYGTVIAVCSSGGIMAESKYSFRDEAGPAEINRCYNAGNVITKGISSTVSRSWYSAGGILGHSRSEKGVIINNCVNLGYVSGIYSVGGISGGTCDFGCVVGTSVNSCVNEGIVRGTGSETNTGGIMGSCRNYVSGTGTESHIYNCVNCGEVYSESGAESTGAIAGYIYKGEGLVIDNCVNVEDKNGTGCMSPVGECNGINAISCYGVYGGFPYTAVKKQNIGYDSETGKYGLIETDVAGGYDRMLEELNKWIKKYNVEYDDKEFEEWTTGESGLCVGGYDSKYVSGIQVADRIDVPVNDFYRAHTLEELNNAVKSSINIILEEDIKLSDYTFDYDEQWKRIGIYKENVFQAAYSAEDDMYYDSYMSDDAVRFRFDDAGWESVWHYTGIIDGNGHTIYGMCPFAGSRGENQPRVFIESIEEYGTVKNLNFSDCFILPQKYNSEGYSYVLCREMWGSVINCSVNNTYIVADEYGNGILSYLNGTMDGCYVSAHIFGRNSCGLYCMAGYAEEMKNCWFDGIIEGKSETVSMGAGGKGKECLNNYNSGYYDVECDDGNMFGMCAGARDIPVRNCVSAVRTSTGNKVPMSLCKPELAGFYDNCYEIYYDNDNLVIGSFLESAAENVDSPDDLCYRMNVWLLENIGEENIGGYCNWVLEDNEIKLVKNETFDRPVVTLRPGYTPPPTSTPVTESTATPPASPVMEATATPPAASVVESTATPPAASVTESTATPPAAPVTEAKPTPPAASVMESTATPPAASVTESIPTPPTTSVTDLTPVSDTALTTDTDTTPHAGNISGKLEPKAVMLSKSIVSGRKVILKWTKVSGASGYRVYRSKHKTGGYTELKSTGSRNYYEDTKVRPCQTWYYKIRAFRKDAATGGQYEWSGYSNRVRAYVGMRTPSVTLSREKSRSGERYIKVGVSKCDGSFVRVYVSGNNKKYVNVKLDDNDWKRMNSTFNLKYTKTGSRLYFKICSYGKFGKNMRYSPYSKVKEIML